MARTKLKSDKKEINLDSPKYQQPRSVKTADLGDLIIHGLAYGAMGVGGYGLTQAFKAHMLTEEHDKKLRDEKIKKVFGDKKRD